MLLTGPCTLLGPRATSVKWCPFSAAGSGFAVVRGRYRDSDGRISWLPRRHLHERGSALLLPRSVWGFEKHAALPKAPAPNNSAGCQGRSLCLTHIHDYMLSFNPSAAPGPRKLIIYSCAHNEALSSVWLSIGEPSITTHKFFLFPFRRQRAVTFYSEMKGANRVRKRKATGSFLHLSRSCGGRGRLGCLCRWKAAAGGALGSGGRPGWRWGAPTHIPEHRHTHSTFLA